MTRPPPRSTLFPYTTLSRSRKTVLLVYCQRVPDTAVPPPAGRLCPSIRGWCACRHQTRPAFAKSKQGKCAPPKRLRTLDRKSTRLNSSHDQISYAVFCLKKK